MKKRLSGAFRRKLAKRQEQRWASRSGPVRIIRREDLPENSAFKADL